MADETLEQMTAHRDQLKVENDRLNPEKDALKHQVAGLTESLRTANNLKEDLAGKLSGAQAANENFQKTLLETTARTADLENKMQAAVTERNAAVAAHNRRAEIHSAVLKVLLDEAQRV